jgi:hypothetical protein
MQVKTTLSFHLIQSEWPLSTTQTATNVGKDLGKKEHLHTVDGNVN